MRIAMWSGPRNLSTAMMYSFGNRADCAVVDEPFYASYLMATGLEHPMRKAIIASQPVDPRTVVRQMLGPIPGRKRHFYQKHMAQHMIEHVSLGWLAKVKNVFLIRHPVRVVASFAAKYEKPTLNDIGFVQLARLFDLVPEFGQSPVVIDSADIRRDPEGMLKTLCTALGLNWDPAMLHWPSGGHPADGIWAAHWYGTVHKSTGFDGEEGPLPDLTGDYRALAEKALPYYQRLSTDKLQANT